MPGSPLIPEPLAEDTVACSVAVLGHVRFFVAS
jgi:hypothetical protein